MIFRKASTAPRLATFALTAALSGFAHAAFIGEPETLIYGRILNRDNPNAEQLVTEGELRWTIRRADGVAIELSGEVDELGGGEHSYLLRIPHQALVLEAQPSELAVPLGASPRTATHEVITLDGAALEMLPPATSGFPVEMVTRGSAIRIDLALSTEPLDGDGDGMPDWWEDEHGLDKQNPNDALTDLNGDGLHNLASFLAGADPDRDPNEPQLITREVIAYSASRSLVLLEVADADSPPEQLTFELRSAPREGRLLLRHAAELPAETSLELTGGSTFSQADVLAGRLVFEHASGEIPDRFEVAVRDEEPTHPEDVGTIDLRLFDPLPTLQASGRSEALRLEAHAATRTGAALVVDLGATAGAHELAAAAADAEPDHVERFGEEPPHFFFGGPSDDRFTGGPAADAFEGGDGANEFTGGEGGDRFSFSSPVPEEQVIHDFDPLAGDVLDLRGCLSGSSILLTDYVRIRRSGADALVEISASGQGSGFSDLVIRLIDSPLDAGDLADLYYAHRIIAGGVTLSPRFSIEVADGGASENGPRHGAFTIRREGALEQAVEVRLQISGNATNGVDYQTLPTLLSFAEGVEEMPLTVRPYVDASIEFDEVVFVQLAASPDYLLSAQSSAQLLIEDLKPQISLEVIEDLATVADGVSGAVLVRRGGVIAPEVFVRLHLSGSAANGSDYDHVPTYLNFSPGQTTRLIEFRPKPDVDFGGAEAKLIRLDVLADAAYARSGEGATVTLAPERMVFASWLDDHGFEDGVEPGGMPLETRYAFAVDPQQPGAAETLRRLPRAVVEDGFLTLRFRRKPAIRDLVYQVEYSNDFTEWRTGPEHVEDITWQVAPDDPGAAVFRATRPMSEADRAVMRVRVAAPDAP